MASPPSPSAGNPNSDSAETIDSADYIATVDSTDSSATVGSADSAATVDSADYAATVDSAATVGSVSEKPGRRVSKFIDEYGVVTPYCQRFDFESNPVLDPKDYNSDEDEEEDTNHVANPRETLIRYVNQIRKSFGFDVDCVAPSWFGALGPVFTPIDWPKYQSSDPYLREYVNNVTDYTLAEISAETGKKYELVKLEKLVAGHLFILYSTLRVKDVSGDGDGDGKEEIIQAIASRDLDDKCELSQWRYKPDEEVVWFQLPPLPSHSEDV